MQVDDGYIWLKKAQFEVPKIVQFILVYVVC